jgi:RsiW-degrading membrane proteinase PrsW (M82 family)
MTVTGKGFAAGEIVLIYLHGTIVAASTADGHGNVSFRFKVPSTIPAGHTTLQAVGARSGYRAQVRVLIY